MIILRGMMTGDQQRRKNNWQEWASREKIKSWRSQAPIDSNLSEKLIERTYAFRTLSEKERKARANLHKASLHTAANVAVSSEQQVAVVQSREISAYAQRTQELAANGDEKQPGLTMRKGFEEVFQQQDNTDTSKGRSWAYWKWLWHTWLGNPQDVLISGHVLESQEDAAFYLGEDPKLQNILYHLSEESGVTDNVLFLDIASRHNLVIKRITKSALEQLIAHAKRFQYGLDFRHLPQGFYLELNKDAFWPFEKKHLCLKYSAARAENQPAKKHAMHLPIPVSQAESLSLDLQEKIDEARRQGDDSRHALEILITDSNSCRKALSYLQNNAEFTPENLDLLLSIYNFFGEDGLLFFLEELQSLHQQDKVLFEQIKQYSLDGQANGVPLLSFKSQTAINALRSLEPKARRIWNELLASHMQVVGQDDLISLATCFSEFSQKISEWRLSWPEIHDSLSSIKNLPVALGRAVTILEACLPEDRQKQFDCIFELNLGPVGAIMTIGEGRAGYHFISDKALIAPSHCDYHGTWTPYDSTPAMKALAERLRPSRHRAKSNQAAIRCGLEQDGVTHSLYSSSDVVWSTDDSNRKANFEARFFRFLGGQYYRPSLQFFEDAFKVKSDLNKVEQSILALATCGIEKVRFANLEDWKRLIELCQQYNLPIHRFAEWYQVPAVSFTFNGESEPGFPYDFQQSPSLPELIQLTIIEAKLIQHFDGPFSNGFADYDRAFRILRDSWIHSFKNYGEDELKNVKAVIKSHIRLFQKIKKEPFDSCKTIDWVLRYSDPGCYSKYGIDTFYSHKKVNYAKDLRLIQRGLIKIISTFKLSEKNLDGVISTLTEAVAQKGVEQTKTALQYLAKIVLAKRKEQLTVEHLNAFLNEFTHQRATELADLLIKHFPSHFGEHQFIRVQKGTEAIYQGLPLSLRDRLDGFSPEIRSVILSFWAKQQKILDCSDADAFLYYLSELQKTIQHDKNFLSLLTQIFDAPESIACDLKDMNPLITLLARDGIQLCSYILQMCEERKVPFSKTYVEALHGRLQPFLKEDEIHPIPAVTALSIITESLLAPKAPATEEDIYKTSQMLDAMGLFYKKEPGEPQAKHYLSQESFIHSISKSIAHPEFTKDKIIEFVERINEQLIPQSPEIMFVLCEQFKNNPNEFLQLLEAVAKTNIEDEFLLDILKKLAGQIPESSDAAIGCLADDFIKVINLHMEKLSGEELQVLRDIYKKSPYPNISLLKNWLSEQPIKLQENYKKFSSVSTSYNEFNIGFALDKASQITKRAGKVEAKLSVEDLKVFSGLLEKQKGLGRDELIAHYQSLKETLHKESGNDDIDLFRTRMNLLAVLTAILYVSTKPAAKSLNETQLTALLFWLKQDGPLTLGIDTGEGKSRISMIASAFLAIEGYAVDFVTSNYALASRDFTEFHAFFASLDIPSSLISANSLYSSYQKGGVNFTDGRSLRLFRSQALLDGKATNELAQAEQEKSALILDEADDAIFDQYHDRCQVSRSLPEFRNMEIGWICESAVRYVREVKSQLVGDQIFDVEDIDRNQIEELQLFKQYIKKKTPNGKALQTLQASYGTGHEKFDKQMVLWLKGALNALELIENEDFEIQSGRLRKTEKGEFLKASDAYIVVNGRIDRDSRWGSWVHPCLEARLNIERKEKLARGEYVSYDKFEVGSEKRVLLSSTVNNLLKYYSKGQILCLTGTPGEEAECAEAFNSYQLSTYKIPRHKANRRVDLPAKYAVDQNEQLEVLAKYVQHSNAYGRPVVVFCKNKSEALRVEEYFKDELPDSLLGQKQANGHYPKLQLITAEIAGTPAEAKKIKAAGKKGMITISTEMIGRGTNIVVEEDYPLETYCTYLPSSRAYRQIAGRAGRYGQRGFSRLVLNKQDRPKYFAKDNPFFFARHAYLHQQQQQSSLSEQNVRLLENFRGKLLNDMTVLFFNQLHDARLQEDIVGQLVTSWGELLDQFESTWARHRVKMSGTISQMKDQIKAFTDDIEENYWHSFLNTCRDNGVALGDASYHFEAYEDYFGDELVHPSHRSSMKLKTSIFDAYDPVTAGTSVIYNAPFQDTIALLTGKRKWFANTRAWLHDPSSATLFADTRAILSGERELFANTRATMARILHFFGLHKFANWIMPKYHERLIKVSESQHVLKQELLLGFDDKGDVPDLGQEPAYGPN